MTIDKLSTKDLLRYLPLGESVRAKLLEVYPDKVTFDQGVIIEDLAWRLFYAYFDMVYDVILRRETMENPGPLEPDHQDRLLRETEEAIMHGYDENVTSAQLEELRKQLGAFAQ